MIVIANYLTKLTLNQLATIVSGEPIANFITAKKSCFCEDRLILDEKYSTAENASPSP